MEFYIIEKLIVTVPVYNARENVTHCQLSVIVNFLRNKDFVLILKEFRDKLKIYIMLSCTHLYHFFPVSIQYLQCIHCLLHQTLENQLLTIYQGVHITYFSNLKFSWCCVSDSETKFYVIWHLYLTSNIMSFNFFVILVAIFYQTFN